VNVDVAPADPSVLRWDVSRALPFAAESFDVVYHSNVLEHLRRDDVLPFVRECWRVLKPGGLLRVATPDLERMCELYLQKLRTALAGSPGAAADYEWMLLELYDQSVRERNGGAMLDFLRQQPLPNERFVFERIGQEGRELVETLRRLPGGSEKPRPLWRRVLRKPRLLFELLGTQVVKAVWGAAALHALEIGRFRLGGEVHQWAYDRFSLARLLTEAGFVHPALRSATDSAIPRWNDFHLDTLPDGTIIKPDALFMEAEKSA
jgi:SAM-dependent methyltransferase